MLIRNFRDGDEESLWRVFYSAIHVTASADYSAEQIEVWATSVNPDMAKWTIRMREMQPFVAENEGAIVGYADVQTSGYIDHFFVSPTMARQGVGSALIKRIHDEAENRKITILSAIVSITAKPFFESWKFEVQKSQTSFFGGIYFNNFQCASILA